MLTLVMKALSQRKALHKILNVKITLPRLDFLKS